MTANHGTHAVDEVARLTAELTLAAAALQQETAEASRKAEREQFEVERASEIAEATRVHMAALEAQFEARVRAEAIILAEKMAAEQAGAERTMTLEDAREVLQSEIADGTTCLCCGQHAKVYRRKINSTMVKGLLVFYRHVLALSGGDKTLVSSQWVHVPRQTALSAMGGDWARLQLWGLIVSQLDTERPDGGPNSGVWRMTEKGLDFVRRKVRVQMYAKIYNASLLGLDGPLVSISEALGDDFSYEELLGEQGDAEAAASVI